MLPEEERIVEGVRRALLDMRLAMVMESLPSIEETLRHEGINEGNRSVCDLPRVIER